MRITSLDSKVIDKTGSVFETIAKKRGLDFKWVKSNTDYVELGGSDKTCTLKIWYDSEIFGRRSFVKVQINFVEQMCFSPTTAQFIVLKDARNQNNRLDVPEQVGAQIPQSRVDHYSDNSCFRSEPLCNFQ